MAGRVADMRRDELELEARNQLECQDSEPLVLCRATVEHELRQLATARGEKSKLRNAEGRT